jgi:hypothetical protein
VGSLGSKAVDAAGLVPNTELWPRRLLHRPRSLASGPAFAALTRAFVPAVHGEPRLAMNVEETRSRTAGIPTAARPVPA